MSQKGHAILCAVILVATGLLFSCPLLLTKEQFERFFKPLDEPLSFQTCFFLWCILGGSLLLAFYLLWVTFRYRLIVSEAGVTQVHAWGTQFAPWSAVCQYREVANNNPRNPQTVLFLMDKHGNDVFRPDFMPGASFSGEDEAQHALIWAVIKHRVQVKRGAWTASSNGTTNDLEDLERVLR